MLGLNNAKKNSPSINR